jgi:hypothetical protein
MCSQAGPALPRGTQRGKWLDSDSHLSYKCYHVVRLGAGRSAGGEERQLTGIQGAAWSQGGASQLEKYRGQMDTSMRKCGLQALSAPPGQGSGRGDLLWRQLYRGAMWQLETPAERQILSEGLVCSFGYTIVITLELLLMGV